MNLINNVLDVLECVILYTKLGVQGKIFSQLKSCTGMCLHKHYLE